MNVLLIAPWEWFGDTISCFKEKIPGLYVTSNYEQVLAMVKDNMVNRVCIIFGGYSIPADEAAQKIHELNPNIPILIWNSCGKTRVASNEVYLDARDFEKEEFHAKIEGFFNTHPVP